MSTLDGTDLEEIRKLLDEMNYEYHKEGELRTRTYHSFIFHFPEFYQVFHQMLERQDED